MKEGELLGHKWVLPFRLLSGTVSPSKVSPLGSNN
jgi:hypothetical protein